jgi:hypothetical protein
MRFANESPGTILERQQAQLRPTVPDRLSYLGYGRQRSRTIEMSTRDVLTCRLIAITAFWSEKNQISVESCLAGEADGGASQVERT